MSEPILLKTKVFPGCLRLAISRRPSLVDERAFYYRIGIGISFAPISLTMFFLAYWHKVMFGGGD
jgi:hypothetical protein